MTFCRRHRGAALVAAAVLAPPALFAAENPGGGLLGWVENTQGAPVAGAVISLFGKGIRGGTLVTLSDSSGQFFLPSLPAGSYTLRALGRGHQPAPAQTITVLPQQDAVFTVSLKPVGDQPADLREAAASPVTGEDEAERERRWLVRHKRRSILEHRGETETAALGPEALSETAPVRDDPTTGLASYMPTLAGTFEIVATPAHISDDGSFAFADGLPTSQGVLKLHGKVADFGEWKLGGLFTESEGTAWRMAAEFVLSPGGGHEIETGAGYGTRYIRPLAGDAPGATLDARSVGSLFARDTWRMGEVWTASVGARYDYVGYLNNGNSVSGYASLERAVGKDGRIHGSFSTRTLAPGGDLLTLSTLGSAPVLGLARVDESLRAERVDRYEIGGDRTLGSATIGAFVFRENAQDQLLNIHSGRVSDDLMIVNGGAVAAQGVGLSLAGGIGRALRGSVAYSYGRATRDGATPVLVGLPTFAGSLREAGYHDVVARIETFIDTTDTRLSAYYRINTMSPEGDPGARVVTNGRFDIRLTQGLPFLQPLTRADWELLVAVRNLFYEDFEGGALDEFAVLHAPKRVMGGFAVKF